MHISSLKTAAFHGNLEKNSNYLFALQELMKEFVASVAHQNLIWT